MTDSKTNKISVKLPQEAVDQIRKKYPTREDKSLQDIGASQPYRQTSDATKRKEGHPPNPRQTGLK